MSNLDDANEAHAAAVATFNRASAAATTARAHLESLEARLAAGDGADIGADDLAKARNDAAHAALVAEGASKVPTRTSAAVQAARAAEVCDEIAERLPRLGDGVAEALDTVAEAVRTLELATAEYDRFATDARTMIDTIGAVSDRVITGLNQTPAVDHLPLGRCRAPSQLAAVIVPAMKAMSAPKFVIDELRTLANAAPDLPRTRA